MQFAIKCALPRVLRCACFRRVMMLNVHTFADADVFGKLATALGRERCARPRLSLWQNRDLDEARRFFTHHDDFELESDLYADPLIRETLPALTHATNNSDGSFRSRSGFRFPPFMVLERGASMAECGPASYQRMPPLHAASARSALCVCSRFRRS